MSTSKSHLSIVDESCLPPLNSSVNEVPNYPDLVVHRMIIPGRAVFFNNQQRVYECLASRGWDNLCNISTPCFPDLVRKFYAQAWIPPVLDCRSIYSMVDGCSVVLTIDDIAKVFNLRREPVSQYPMEFEVLKTKLVRIATALRGEDSYELFDLHYKDLTEEYQFLYEITIANLLPSTRSSNIPMNFSTFLYAVMSNYKVDLASIIWNEIVDGIKSIGFDYSPLPYGSLISHLLFKGKVEILSTEISSRPIDPIGSVKMVYHDLSDCNSFGDLGISLSLVSKDIHKEFNKVFSRLDRFESLHSSHEALRSRVNHQEVRFRKLVNGGYLSYEEEEAIERTRADD